MSTLSGDSAKRCDAGIPGEYHRGPGLRTLVLPAFDLHRKRHRVGSLDATARAPHRSLTEAVFDLVQGAVQAAHAVGLPRVGEQAELLGVPGEQAELVRVLAREAEESQD